MLILQPSPSQVHRKPAPDEPHPHNRVSLPAGLHAGGRRVPRQSSPYVHATVPPTRASPAAWVALARSNESTPNIMPNSMLGTEGQGATTAASLFGVFAKEAVSDET